MVADKLGRAAGHDCLTCWTEQGAVEVTFEELLAAFNSATVPAELVQLNYLLSNTTANNQYNS